MFLLKPSVRELRECIGRELATEADQAAAAQEIVQRGQAQVVVVSLGNRGALVITPSAAQRIPAINMRSGSGVDAGDAMVAAITVGLSRGWPLSKSVRFGVAAGAAMLMTPCRVHSWRCRAPLRTRRRAGGSQCRGQLS